MKTVILYDRVGPYHRARISALNRKLGELIVIELRGKSLLYPWQDFPGDKPWHHETLFPDRIIDDIPTRSIQATTAKSLEHFAPEIVITPGYRDPTAQAAASWARQSRAKCILMLESWKGDKRRFWWKERAKSWLLQRWFHAAFVGGWRHYLYARSLGFSRKLIWRGVDVVDNAHFSKECARYKSEAANHRRRLKLPERFFLCVARCRPEKNLITLLRAFQMYQQNRGEWGLVVVGDGPLRLELEDAVRRLQLKYVKFTGWVQYDEICAYYALANVFILPSISEPWGLVVNEAMASGLPILASRKCGCLPELVWRGVNGYDFDPMNIGALTYLMQKMSRETKELRRMGKRSQMIISSFTPETWADALADCINEISRRDRCI